MISVQFEKINFFKFHTTGKTTERGAKIHADAIDLLSIDSIELSYELVELRLKLICLLTAKM